MKELLNNVLFVCEEIDSIANGTNEQYESLYDFIADALDIEYTCDSRKQYLGCRFAVSLGGPSIYVNTRTGNVEGYWGGNYIERSFSSAAQSELDSICEGYFDSF